MFKPRTILPTLPSDRKLRKHLALGISSVALPFVLTGNVFAHRTQVILNATLRVIQSPAPAIFPMVFSLLTRQILRLLNSEI